MPQTMKPASNFRREVEAIQSLPSLPAVVGKILQVVNSPTSTAKELGEVISYDPSLASKILRVANSALYGMPRKIDSLDFSIVVLGMSKVRDLALGISVIRSFRSIATCRAFDRSRFWEHCATCGPIAQYVAARVGLNLGHEAFVSGLLHDVGKIVLDNYFHDRFAESLEMTEDQQMRLYEAEAEVFGANHADVGGWLAERWDFPSHLCHAIAFHHAPLDAPDDSAPLVCACHVADAITKGKSADIMGLPGAFVLEDDPAWRRLRETTPRCAGLDVERMFFELDDELREVRELLRILEEPGSIL